MFSNKAEKPGTKSAGKAPAAPSILSANLKIVGNLDTDGEMQIDGTVNGDVSCAALTIGEGATVVGEILAETIVVHGRIEGRIKAKRVQLSKTARVTGDIWHDSLSIDAGAYLDGHCRRNEAEGGRTLKVMSGGDKSTSSDPEGGRAGERASPDSASAGNALTAAATTKRTG